MTTIITLVWWIIVVIFVAIMILRTLVNWRQSAIKQRERSFHVLDTGLIDQACVLTAECDTLFRRSRNGYERNAAHRLRWEGCQLIQIMRNRIPGEPDDGKPPLGELPRHPDAEFRRLLDELRQRLAVT